MTRDVSAKLEQMDCDPILGMARLAKNVRNTPELRGRMFAELAQYLHAKRKAIELTGKDGAALIPLEMVDAILDEAGKS